MKQFPRASSAKTASAAGVLKVTGLRAVWAACLGFGLMLSPTALCADAPPPGQQEQKFLVRGLGLKLGELWVATRTNGQSYQTATQFATTGALKSIAKVRFDMRAEGRWGRRGPEPRAYVEAVNTSRRQSNATLSYAGGIPRVEGGELSAEGPAVNPLTQRGTVDPATGFMQVIGPVKETSLCDLDLAIFDGARRTRVVLSPPLQTEAGYACRGAYIREAGYSAKQVRRAGSFDLNLNYVRRRDGQYVLISGRVQTIFGPILLEWQPSQQDG